MRDIGRRIEQLEAAIGALDCICGEQSAMSAAVILAIDTSWDEARIRLEEDAKQICCPVHGAQIPTIVPLVGSDVYG